MSGFEIFFEDARKYEDEAEFRRAYDTLTDMRKLKVEACKRDDVKRLSLATGHLLVSVLIRYGFDPNEVCLGEYGKPYLPGHGVFFSLANKNTQAIMTVSLNDIGCDLEFVSERKYSPLMVKKKYFPEEKKLMDAMGDRERKEAFFSIWTQKEAYGKLLGTGLRDAVCLNTALIDGGFFNMASKEFKMSAYPHPKEDYIISVCQYV